jgi:hypothetical protein
MGVQLKTAYSNIPFYRGGVPYILDSETIVQDAARVAVLADKTIMHQDATTRKWTPLADITPLLGGYMVAGALGTTLPLFQAITDGEFALSVGGTALDVTGLDFSDINAPSDTPAYMTCGTNGAIIAAGWNALTDGEFAITVNGVAHDVTGIDCNTVQVTTFDEVAETISYAVAPLGLLCIYDTATNAFRFVSLETGRDASVSVLSAVGGGAGTDISGAGYLNGLTGTGTATAGTGGIGASITSVINAAALGKFRVEWDASGNNLIFLAPSGQAITVLSAVAAGAGTDISGAGYLNGLTGTGTVTAPTGEQIPMGIYRGEEIAAATLVAGDVTNQSIVVGGQGLIVDLAQLVLENSLTVNSVIVSKQKTVAAVLREIGIFANTTTDISG